MTIYKILFLIFIAVIFVLTLSLYKKTSVSVRNFTISAFFMSAGIGLLSLFCVFTVGLFAEEILPLNLCSVSASIFGSAPAVITMLFLNIL